jgi:hypothetical protein
MLMFPAIDASDPIRQHRPSHGRTSSVIFSMRQYAGSVFGADERVRRWPIHTGAFGPCLRGLDRRGLLHRGLARNGPDWHHLIDLCALVAAVSSTVTVPMIRVSS